MRSARPDLKAVRRLLVSAAPALVLAVVVGGRALTEPPPAVLLRQASSYDATRQLTPPSTAPADTADFDTADFDTVPPVTAVVPTPPSGTAVSSPAEAATPASTTTGSERVAPVEPVPVAAASAPVEPDERVVEPVEPAPATAVGLPPPVPEVPAPLAGNYAGSSASSAALVMGVEAMGLISYPWQENLPGWRIEFHDARSGYRGLTFPAERVIAIYVRPDLGVWATAEVIAHELGHAVDVDRLDDADRNAWRRQRGMASDHVWFPDAYATDFASGAGDWAESFAVWQLGSPSRSTAAGQPTAADLALLARLAA